MMHDKSASPLDNDFHRRLIQLETQLTHQQHVCDQLNDELVEHSKRVTRLERVIVQLENQVRDVQQVAREPRDLHDEKPPHY